MNDSAVMSGPPAPKPTNRGAETAETGAEAGCGWFQATCWTDDRGAALAQIGEVLGVEPTLRDGGYPYYRLAWDLHPGGSFVGLADRDAGAVHVQLKQEACDQLGSKIVDLAQWTERAAARKFARVDVAVNDRARRVMPKVAYLAYRDGEAVTRVRSKWVRFQENAEDGQTTYFGSVSSNQMLRVYDKDREQGAPLGTFGIRWETQARNEAAGDLAQRFFGLGPFRGVGVEPGAVAWSVIRRLVDFRERASSSHQEFRKLLPWWHELVREVPKAMLPKDDRRRSIDEVAAWASQQWPASLAKLVEHPDYGWRFIEQLAAEGSRRLGEQDVRESEALRRDQLAQSGKVA